MPLLAPMSEVAGRLSIEAAGLALRKHAGGRGLLLGGVPGVPAARVVVIGGGVVGTHVARMAAGLGAEVTIIDRSIPRLRALLDDLFAGRVRARYSTGEAIEEELAASDVVVGAVLISGASAPKLMTRAMLAGLKPGAVTVDVMIDQDGCAETSRPTTHDAPTYEVDGIVHYCVANMPGAVPLTSSHALNNRRYRRWQVVAERDEAVRRYPRTTPILRQMSVPASSDSAPRIRKSPRSCSMRGVPADNACNSPYHGAADLRSHDPLPDDVCLGRLSAQHVESHRLVIQRAF